MHILVISEILFKGGDDTVELGGCRGLRVFSARRTTAVNHELCHRESLVVGDRVGVLGKHPVVFIVIATSDGMAIAMPITIPTLSTDSAPTKG